MVLSRRQLLQGVVLTGVGLAGCTGDGGGGQSPTETATPTETEANQTTTVEMVNTSFDPLKVSIDTGETIKWTNKDSYQHDVTSAQFHDAAEQWEYAKTLGGGESVSRTFDSAGVYEYYCTIHGKSTMCGAVLVGDASLSKSLPCERDAGGGY